MQRTPTRNNLLDAALCGDDAAAQQLLELHAFAARKQRIIEGINAAHVPSPAIFSIPDAAAILQETIESFKRKARDLRAIAAQHEAHLPHLDGRGASECRTEASRLKDKASTYEYEARAIETRAESAAMAYDPRAADQSKHDAAEKENP